MLNNKPFPSVKTLNQSEIMNIVKIALYVKNIDIAIYYSDYLLSEYPTTLKNQKSYGRNQLMCYYLIKNNFAKLFLLSQIISCNGKARKSKDGII